MSLSGHGNLTIAMRSDWRVGTGAGSPGATDSLVRRDADDLPFLPAKTVTGMWRDATDTVARALGDTWPDAVALLFGSTPARQTEAAHRDGPIPAALSVRPARLSPDLRARLTGGGPARQRLREALTFVKPAVKIDELSGRAVDKFLRFDELVRGGATLSSEFSVDLARLGDAAQPALALLYGAATFIERFGGDRRRGAGRALVGVEGIALDEIVGLLSATPAPHFAAPGRRRSGPPSRGASAAAGSAWRRVTVGFTLRAPVLAGATVAGNVVTSLDYLPGAYVLAAITGILADEPVAEVLQAGDLLVTPATLAIDGERGRPVPLCFEEPKDDQSTLVNRFASPDAADVRGKQVKDGYLGPGTAPTRATVAMSITTHSTIDEGTQRPTTEIGGVFSYAAIGAGQRLVAELRVRGDRLRSAGRIAAALDGATARLGRSKKDDYGLASIDAAASDHPGAGSGDGAECSGATIWLLSDVVACDRSLRPDPSIRGLLSALAAALDTPVTLAEDSAPNAIVATGRTDSWHAGWQLPRETIVALRAGSCAKLRFGRAVNRATLAELELSGIGRRRGEGFGQVAFDDPLLATASAVRGVAREPCSEGHADEPDGPQPSLVPLDGGHPSAAFARRIEDAAWRDEIARRAALASADDDTRFAALGLNPRNREMPHTAQLSALRNAALRLSDEPGALRAWLDGVLATPARGDLWPAGTLAGGAPGGGVRRLCTEPGYVWGFLSDPTGLLGPASAMCLTREPADLMADLETWALQALVDACVHAIVRQREDDRAKGTGNGA